MSLTKGLPHWAVYTVCGPRNRWRRNQKLTLSGNLTYRRTRGDAGWSELSSWSHRERKTTICKLGELAVLKTPWEAGANGETPWPDSSAFPPIFHDWFPRAKSCLPSRRPGGLRNVLPFYPQLREGGWGLICSRKWPIQSACPVLPNKEYSILRPQGLSPGKFGR